MIKIVSVELITGLGNAEAYYCIPGNGSDETKFWDFVGLTWVTPITADCKIFAIERNSDGITSLYRADIPVPSGSPYIIQCFRESTGERQGFEMTTEDAILEDTGTTLPTEIGTPMQAGSEVVASNMVDITNLTNAISALQSDLGDPSVDATTIYDQALLIKGYVAELETRLSATRAGYIDNLSGGAVALDSTVAKEATLEALSSAMTGSGDTVVNHNTGGVDNLRCVDGSGNGIDDVTILAYLKSDYDAGNRSPAYIKGTSVTQTDGRWERDINLDSGLAYKIVFYKQGIYQATTKEITI